MKKIEAKIIADSLSPQGHRITSYLLTYPRFIHSELMTYRMFSRNSASSRAIPFERMVKMVEEDPFIPIAWQKDHKGMQGTEYLTDRKHENAVYEWLKSRDLAVKQAKMMNNDGVTKQLCNRLLEPFMWHTMLITGSKEGWDNFFELRCPKYRYHNDNTSRISYYKSKKDWIYEAENNTSRVREHERRLRKNPFLWFEINEGQAEIHIQALAEAMWDARNESTPKQLQAGEWHIPFGDNIMMSILDQQDIAIKFPSIDSVEDLKIRIATARCARLSYMTFDGEIDYEKDLKLHDQLLESKHFSPFEHCARVMSNEEYNSFIKGKSNENWDVDLVTDDTFEISAQFDRNVLGWCNNFRGFIPYRYLIENEKI